MGYHLGETRSGTTIVALVTNVATIQNFHCWPPDAAPKTDLSLLLPSILRRIVFRGDSVNLGPT